LRILVSNDDGIFSLGIRVLAQSLRQIAHVDVVAPDRDCSAASHSLTIGRPLRVKILENGGRSVEGTPTDCVHLATTGLLSQQPDMVVSGINDGPNLGDDTLYSGTVAAAVEGRYLGLPAIAISLLEGQPRYYETAAAVAKNLVMRLQAEVLPLLGILNVNVPNVPVSELKGLEVTRLGSRHRAEPVIQGKDPWGRPLYWVGSAGAEQDAGLGTDFDALKRGYVAITPLQIDLTHYKVFDQLVEWTDHIALS